MLVFSRSSRTPDIVLTLPDGRQVRVVFVGTERLTLPKLRVKIGIDAPADVVVRRGETQPLPPADGGT